jgi:hypothetical protein
LRCIVHHLETSATGVRNVDSYKQTPLCISLAITILWTGYYIIILFAECCVLY